MKTLKKLLKRLIIAILCLLPLLITVIVLTGAHGWGVSILAGFGVEFIVAFIAALAIRVGTWYKDLHSIEEGDY